MRCGMMSQNPRSERDFEKTLSCFKSKAFINLASSCVKFLILASYICCECSGKEIVSIDSAVTVRISHSPCSESDCMATWSHNATVSFLYSFVGKSFKFSRRKRMTWL